MLNERASAQQKAQAVSQVGTTIVVDAARKTARKNAPKVIQAVKKVAPAAGIVGAAAATVYAGGKALTANRKREANRFADAELKKTEKRMKHKLTAAEKATLRQQYYDFAVKRPVTNPFLGK